MTLLLLCHFTDIVIVCVFRLHHLQFFYANFQLHDTTNLCIYEDGICRESNAGKTKDKARYVTAKVEPKAKPCKLQTTTTNFNR